LKAYCRQCNTIEALHIVTPGQLATYNAEQLARLLARLNLVAVENADAFREPRIEVLMREIQLRVLAPTPIIPCDDADGWNDHAKKLQVKRRDHIRAERRR
jgi:hypothetical protein